MASVPRQKVPPLETGDRLSRAEFERRYDAMPGLKKAELIEGVVYVPSPVRIDRHGRPHFDLIAWLGFYRWATPGVSRSRQRQRPARPGQQAPAGCHPLHGPGQGRSGADLRDDYVEDAPELVAEIASSSVSYDLTLKLKVYRRNGVSEYIVWRVLDRQIDWFILQRRRFVRMPLDETGLYQSKVFPGLWLDPAALVRGDTAALQSALQRGLASREHADFVARLNRPT